MKNRDLRLGIVLMVIFLVLFGITFTFRSSHAVSTHTTAAFFPRVVLVVLMILDALLIMSSWRKGTDSENDEKMDPGKKKRVMASMGLGILFALGAPYIGTLVCIGLFIIAVMVTWGVKNKMSIILNAVLTPVFIYLVFTKILLVQLPSGVLK